MNNYLIFRTDRIGDFLISSILIKSIKLNDNRAHISVVCSSKNYSYIKDFNFIDEVFLLENSFINKLKIILSLKKRSYKNIIVHDDKRRSKFISFFLKGKKKIYIKDKEKFTHIEIIKNILNASGLIFNNESLNFLDERKVTHDNKEKFILFHFDEKWIFDDYIKKFKNIEPSEEELISFLNSMITKTQKKIIITTGTKTPNIIKKVKSSLDSNKIKFLDNQNFNDLEQIVSKCEILISCHGAISHVAAAKRIKQIDIIDKSYDYSRWTSHFRNYNYLYREKFSNLSKEILQKL